EDRGWTAAPTRTSRGTVAAPARAGMHAVEQRRSSCRGRPHRGDVSARREPRRRRQTFRLQKRRIEELRLIALAGIAEDRDDRLAGAELAREPDRARDVDARRPAEQQPFDLEEIVEHGQHLRVRYLQGVVDLRAVQIAGDAALAYALADRAAFALQLAGLDPAVDRGPHRVRRGRHDVRVLVLQILRDARERAARADRADERVDPPVGLLPDLGARALHMALAVREVVPLIRVQHAVLLGRLELLGGARGDVDVVV